MFKLRRSAWRRAYEAQVELARLLLKPGMDRPEIATALSAVVTTAELTESGWNERNTSSRFVRFEQVASKHRGPKSLRERSPDTWAELEAAVWALLGSGRGGKELLEAVFTLIAPHCVIRLVPPRKILRLADAISA